MRNRSYREANRSREASQKRAYYRQHRDRILERNAAWRDQNRERMALLCRAGNVRHRGKLRGAEGHCTTAAFRARWDFYGGKCWMCGADADQIDHVIPLSKGGTSWPANLRPACRSCNRKKWHRRLDLVPHG